jgi:hypothetical protein
MLKIFYTILVLQSGVAFATEGCGSRGTCADSQGTCPASFCAGTRGCELCQKCSGEGTWSASSGLFSCKGSSLGGAVNPDGSSKTSLVK